MEKYVSNEINSIKYFKDSGLVLIGKSSIVYILHLFLIHFIFWLSFNIYSIVCVPTGLGGFVKSLLFHGSFVCNIMFEILSFSKVSVYSMIVHLLSGIATAQWLNYKRIKNNY